MQQSEFEKQVQQKMQEHNIDPAPGVWHKIESQLPKRKKRRYILLFLLPLLLMGSLMVYYFITPYTYDKQQLNDINKNETTIRNERENVVPDNMDGSANEISKRPVPITSSQNKKHPTGISSSINKTEVISPVAGEKNTGNQQVKRAGIRRMKAGRVIQPASVLHEGPNYISKLKAERQPEIQIAFADSTKAAKDLANDISGIESTVTGNKQVEKAEEPLAAIKTNSKTKDKRTGKKWNLSAEAMAGISNITSEPFGHSNIYISNNSTGQAYTTPGAISFYPASPKNAFAFNLGLMAQKSITKNTKLGLGIRFSRYAAKTMVGYKLDTVTSIVYATNNITPGNVFSRGNTMRFTNKLNLLEIPLTMQYQPVHNLPASVEMGFVPGYLLNADVLQFDKGRAVYFTNKSSYNHLLISAQVGFNLEVARRSRVPFSIGYRYYYQATSILKKEFGKQHITNSGIVVKFHL